MEQADYQELEPTLLHELDLAFFEDRYPVAGAVGRQILDVMAQASGGATALALRRALPELGNIDEHIRRLVDRGLTFRPSRGRYDFALPLFRAYLRRRESHSSHGRL